MNRAISIVDDHCVLAQSLVLALNARGLEAAAVPVSSFEVTLSAAIAARADLVILDLHLGADLDGTSLIRPLTEAGSDVLVVTGSS
jgi:ActR/RegA family two-component response regulator